jgi:hypothetical protein
MNSFYIHNRLLIVLSSNIHLRLQSYDFLDKKGLNILYIMIIKLLFLVFFRQKNNEFPTKRQKAVRYKHAFEVATDL